MVSWTLRIGLILVFLYASISTLMHPADWEGFVPTYLTNNISAETIVKLTAVYEIALVIWLISGKWLKYCALVCTVTFAAIVIANPSQLITTFRDVGLAFMALAVYFSNKKSI